MSYFGKALPKIIICLNIVSFSVYSQTCGTDEHHQWLLQNDAIYRNEFYELQKRIDISVAEISASGKRQMVYTIPVVVHVIHLGESFGTGSNIPNQQIVDAIRGLNERFRRIIGVGVDMEIEFCLASVDPNGAPTTGINRVDGSGIPDYSSKGIEYNGNGGASEVAVKTLSVWSHTEYYNIWVVHRIYGGLLGGYANFPGNSPYEGTVITSDAITYSSSTLAHEVGHGFGLMHPFEGDGDNSFCPQNIDCSMDGDKVCDTPPHMRNECGTSTSCGSFSNWDNSRYNYMSYCPNVSRFTQGQKDRATSALLVSPRQELLNSQGCSSIIPNCSSINCNDGDACSVDGCINGICVYEAGWKKQNLFPGAARYEAVAFSIGNKGYYGLGIDIAGTLVYLKDFWEYIPATDTWTQKADFPGSKRETAVCLGIGNKGYVGMGYRYLGGSNFYTDFWEYNPATNTWTQKANFPGAGRKDATEFTINDKGYIGLGWADGGQTFDDFWEYNSVNDTWSQKSDFGGGERYKALGFTIDGRGYVGLGIYNGNDSNDFWEYDPNSDLWTQKSSFPDSLYISSTLVGFSFGNRGYFLKTHGLWSYNANNDKWSRENTPISSTNTVAFGISNSGYLIHWKDIWASCECTVPSAPAAINGDTIPCPGDSIVYFINDTLQQVYNWKMPPGWLVLTGQGTDTILVIAGDSSGIISVTTSNSCYASAATEFLVTRPVCSVGIGGYQSIADF